MNHFYLDIYRRFPHFQALSILAWFLQLYESGVREQKVAVLSRPAIDILLDKERGFTWKS